MYPAIALIVVLVAGALRIDVAETTSAILEAKRSVAPMRRASPTKTAARRYVSAHSSLTKSTALNASSREAFEDFRAMMRVL